MTPDQPSCPLCGSPLDGEVCPACTLQMLTDLEGPEPQPENTNSPKIPGLTVHEEIGEGGFGIVYLATQTDVVNRRVALKILKPGVDTRAVLKRFTVEQQALASLEHPYIARFYNAGETPDGYPWFTMEYIDGEPITDALAAQDLNTILDTFLKVCEAVAFAHESDILHRDLKPTNILVTANGTPKVIDFGVAKMTSHDLIPGATLYTANEIQIGTPAYSAPEKGQDLDARSDLYALGATLYETVTGLTPEPPLSLSRASKSSVREVPNDLSHVIAKATHSNPDKRYSSVELFMEDLRKLRAGQHISKPFPLTIPVTILATLIIGFLVWQLFPEKEDIKEVPAEPLSVRIQASGSPGAFAINKQKNRALGSFRGNGMAILFDPRDGHTIATYSPHPRHIGSIAFDETGERFLLGFLDGVFRWYSSETGEALSPFIDCTPGPTCWVVKLRHFTPRGSDTPSVLTVTPDNFARSWTEEGEMNWQVPLVSPPYDLAISPDGKFALSGSSSGRLNFIDLLNPSKKILTGHKSEIYRIVYSPDGSLFSCASFDHYASIWKSDGTLVNMLPHDDKVQQVGFSPDGQLLGSVSWDGNAHIWEVATGKLLQTMPHDAPVITMTFTPDSQTLITGGRGNAIHFWNVASGEKSRPSIPIGAEVGEFDILELPNGQVNLLASTAEAAIRVIQIN